MLSKRIELMYASQQMDSQTYEQLPSLLEDIEQKLGVKLEDDNAGAFVTHLIKAIQRTKEGRAIVEDPTVIELTKEKRKLFEWGVDCLRPYTSDPQTIEGEVVYLVAYFEMILGEEFTC